MVALRDFEPELYQQSLRAAESTQRTRLRLHLAGRARSERYREAADAYERFL